MTTRNSHIDAVRAESERLGAAVVAIDLTRRHAHITVRKGDVERDIVCAKTPSDGYRGPANVRASVRRALGVASRPAHKGPRRARAHGAPKAAAPLPADIVADTRQSLREGLAVWLEASGGGA